MIERKKITFDSFIRGIISALVVIGILWLLNRLSNVLVPFFLAWLLAYFLYPMVKFFQYTLRFRYRVLAIVATFVVVIGVLAGLFFLVIPPVIEETIKVKDLITAYFSHNATLSNIPLVIQEFIRDNIDQEKLKMLFSREDFLNGIKEALPKVWNVVAQSFNLLFSLLSLLIIFLYTLFILFDYEKITHGWPNLVPRRYRRYALRIVLDVEEGMNKYFRGQALVAFCVGVLFSIGFLIIDFPMAIGLGMFIGLLNMVPYLQIVGFIPTVMLAILKSADTGQNFWIILLLALIVFAVVQSIQDIFLTPHIMGKVTGLNSAIILLSLSVWGSLMGVLGMIIALPLTTLLINYYQRYVINHEKMSFEDTAYSKDSKAEKGAPSEPNKVE